MPATEDVWRNLRTMHIVSAASAFALLASTLWMMQADYADEWRDVQRVGFKLQAQQLEDDILALSDEEFVQKEKDLAERKAEAQKIVDAQKDKIAEAENEVKQLEGHFQKLSREVKFKRAERDAARADLD